MQEKYLPIGTIVLLKGGKKRLMIIGFCPLADDKSYDYVGCIYPEGIITMDKTPVFNHDQIEKIYSLGYSDEEEKEFKNKLKEILENVINSNDQ